LFVQCGFLSKECGLVRGESNVRPKEKDTTEEWIVFAVLNLAADKAEVLYSGVWMNTRNLPLALHTFASVNII
jgi:hypothetical protein